MSHVVADTVILIPACSIKLVVVSEGLAPNLFLCQILKATKGVEFSIGMICAKHFI